MKLLGDTPDLFLRAWGWGEKEARLCNGRRGPLKTKCDYYSGRFGLTRGQAFAIRL